MRSKFLAATAVASLAATASADTVMMKFAGPVSGRGITVNVNGTADTVFAGLLSHQITSGTGAGASLVGSLESYCIDVLEPLSFSEFEFDLAELTDAPVTPPPPAPPTATINQAQADAIARLYTAAAGAQFGSNADFNAAFQITLWEIVNDFDTASSTLSLTAGDFQAGGLNTITTGFVGDLFAAATSDSIGLTPGLRALTSLTQQDQIFQIVIPLPTTAGLAAVGLAAIGLRRRR
ncbi:MAG: hypothetical protein AAFX79_09455 [Planctomycetota bacterium]